MKRLLKYFSFAVLLLSLFNGLPAQSRLQKKADGLFQHLGYAKAIPLYHRLVARDSSAHNMTRLADCYRLSHNPGDAEKWYGHAHEKGKLGGESLRHYGAVLHMNEKFEEAIRAYQKYVSEVPGQRQFAMRQIAACRFASRMQETSPSAAVSRLGVNSSASDIAPVMWKGELFFASNRKRGGLKKLLDARVGDQFYDLYHVPREGTGFGRARRMKGAVNSRFHDAPILFVSADLAWVTRNNSPKKIGEDKAGNARLGIVAVRKKGKKWVKVDAPVKSNSEYSFAHPSLSPDGSVLFFVSDMLGGKGGTDIYMMRREGEGWGEPENLGTPVNTAGNELFPTASDDGVLFFASDGHLGMGGLDLFMTTDLDGYWENPRNLGTPINSPADDFSLYLDRGRPSGMFSSNRPGGEGSDELYAFKRKLPIRILVLETNGAKPIQNAQVTVASSNGKEECLETSEEGLATYVGDWTRALKLGVVREGFEPVEIIVKTKDVHPMGAMDVTLEMEKRSFLAGRVMSKQDGEPLSGAEIRVSSGGKMVQTDHNGLFEINRLKSQDHVLEVMKDGYLPRYVDIKAPSLTAGVPIEIFLDAHDEALITGTVRGGEEVDNLEISISATDRPRRDSIFKTRPSVGGQYVLPVPADKEWTLFAHGEGYFADEKDIPIPIPKGGKYEIDIEVEEIEEGDLIKTIYFDYNDSTLRNEYFIDLENVVMFLKANPRFAVELSSHTDSRGSTAYNQRLSDSRAKASVEYFLSRGISPNRIIGQGKGEAMLKNECRDGVECSELQHGENRRTEIRVMKIGEGQKQLK